MNRKVLDINFGRLATLLLPMALRKSGMMALLDVLTSSLAYVLGLLCVHYDGTRQRLKYTGQVCRLEYMLNYIVGERSMVSDLSYAGRIRVRDGSTQDTQPYLVYLRQSQTVYKRPVKRGLTDQVILNSRYNNNRTYYSFVVEAPQALRDREQEIKALTNTYKTQGKAWALVYK